MTYERKNEHSGKVVQRISVEWVRLIQFCQQLGHGEIEKLKIQDGVPVIADGKMTGAKPGQVLRGPGYKAAKL